MTTRFIISQSRGTSNFLDDFKYEINEQFQFFIRNSRLIRLVKDVQKVYSFIDDADISDESSTTRFTSPLSKLTSEML